MRRRSALHRAAIVLVALAWSGLGLCGEIHDAAKNGDLKRIKALLKANPVLISNTDDLGMTPLHWAASRGRTEAVKLLLANGADVQGEGQPWGDTI